MIGINEVELYINIMDKASDITMELLERKKEEVDMRDVQIAISKLDILEDVVIGILKSLVNGRNKEIVLRTNNDVIRFIINQKETIRRLFL